MTTVYFKCPHSLLLGLNVIDKELIKITKGGVTEKKLLNRVDHFCKGFVCRVLKMYVSKQQKIFFLQHK